MSDVTEPTALPTWRRSPTAAPKAEPDRPPRCGGPEYTLQERFELMRERQREMDEAAEREREEQEALEAKQRRGSRPDDEDEDGYQAADRFRNDRYAVGLLRSDDSAWGGGDAGSGVLG
jgi:hypothetical protein